MTRDELKQAIFDTLRADKERQWDTPAVELEVIMALVDTYSIGVVLDAYHAGNTHEVTEQDAIDWLKARK